MKRSPVAVAAAKDEPLIAWIDIVKAKGLNISTLQKLCFLVAGHLSPQSIKAEEWPLLVDSAAEHRLLPFLAWLLDQSRTPIPDEIHQQLSAHYRQAATRVLVLQTAQLGIARALDAAGIPHVWLKGIALAATVYPDAALRPMVDLDFLVAYDQRQAALDCLHRIGYDAAESPNLLDFNTQSLHELGKHFVLRGGPAGVVTVELHYRLLDPKVSAFLTPAQQAWLHQQTATYSVGGAQLVTLTAESHLLFLCAHMVLQHGLADFVLTRLLDIHYMVTKQQIDWATLLNKAAELRWTFALEQALRLSHKWFATPIPQRVLDSLRNTRPPDDDMLRTMALAQPGAQFEHVRRDLSLLTWKQRVVLAWRIAVPNRDYMRWRYQVAADRPVWPSYFLRWRIQLREFTNWIVSQVKTRWSRANHDGV